MRHDNENDPLTFQKLAAVTAKLLQNENQETEGAPDKGEREHEGKKNPEGQRAYVDQRLRELAAFEKRARGTR